MEDWLEHHVLAELPHGWDTTRVDGDGSLTLQCQHVVLGGHEFHWETAADDDRETEAERVREVVARLGELGLVEASRTMPKLGDAETEILREVHAVIGAAGLSLTQARSVIGLTHSLRQVSDDTIDWALDTLDLLAPWYGFTDEDA